MPCIGVDCDIRQEKVSFIECSACDKCNQFPSILKKRFLFRSFRHLPPQISVTNLVGCPKQDYLKLTTNWYMGRGGFISMGIGSALHKYLEPISDISEERVLWTTPEGNECIGYFDSINIANRILYDIKTTSYGKTKRDGGEGKKDILQIQIYATILKKVYGLDLHGLKLVYVGLGDKDCHEVDVPFNDEIAEQVSKFINERTNLLTNAINNEQVPKAEPLEEWECEYCSFAEGCEERVEKEGEK